MLSGPCAGAADVSACGTRFGSDELCCAVLCHGQENTKKRKKSKNAALDGLQAATSSKALRDGAPCRGLFSGDTRHFLCVYELRDDHATIAATMPRFLLGFISRESSVY
jgi:hypothetical protein